MFVVTKADLVEDKTSFNQKLKSEIKKSGQAVKSFCSELYPVSTAEELQMRNSDIDANMISIWTTIQNQFQLR